MPTRKQSLAFDEFTRNHASIRSSMLLAGYDLDTAKKPKNLTESKGWKQLLTRFLPDDLLAVVHYDGLMSKDNQGNPDYSVRHKYLDTAYKIKDKYPQKQINAFQFNFGTDQQKFKE